MNYKEMNGQATKWRRACVVTISNPLNRTPTVAFQEQDVLSFDGEHTVLPGQPGSVSTTFDPAGSIALLNPETGEPLGQSLPQSTLYVALYSLYMHLAAQRDAQPPDLGLQPLIPR